MKIPRDPFILFSFLNTQLRDTGLSLADFCAEHELDAEQLKMQLAEAGFRYDPEQNRFR
ncbi:MAG: DUF4250 domain-containing protein [Oscillospiraceae bacterium]|nr:DUF4250 domain-containing protein [Oscillospiraceae bacterium]MCR4761876.1 DUF4250 domain-containing protein [Oscillospiraceae bacterium]